MIALIFCFISHSYAGGNGAAAAVTTFHYYNGHIGLLIAQNVMVNPDNCERSEYYILQKDHPYYKEITALIMAAHFSSQPLIFFVQGCAQGIPAIQHVVSYK